MCSARTADAPRRILAIGGGGFLILLSGMSAGALDDGAAVMFSGTVIHEVICWRSEATAYRIECQAGPIVEIPYVARPLP